MKKYYVFLAALFFSFTINAQIINNLGPEFKNALVNTYCVAPVQGSIGTSDVDTNDDGEISVAEAEAVIHLVIGENDIYDATGIEYFINLESLYCDYSSLYTLDVSELVNLQYLNCANNQLTTLDVTALSNLTALICSSNPLTTLNTNNLPNLQFLDCNQTTLNTLVIDNLPSLSVLLCYQGVLETLTLGDSPNLVELDCSENQITALDLTGTPNLDELYCWNNQITFLDLSNKAVNTYYYICNNNQIETLLIKNGSEIEDMIAWDLSEFDFSNNPLTYVCGDENEIGLINSWLAFHEIPDCAVSSYCSFVPGGDYYTVEGDIKFDSDSNGCDTNDAIFPNLNFTVTNGVETGNFIANDLGNYSIPVQSGTHTLTPTFENPSYFSVLPGNLTVSYPSDSSPYVQDFCVTPNGVYYDLEITLIPIEAARPGFDTNYKLIYKNKGTTTLSGNIELSFQDDIMDFVSALPSQDTQVMNLLTWNFTGLMPFESREVNLIMNLHAPTDFPPLNDGDILTFNTSIEFTGIDEDPDDNMFELNQTIVNSFDPNDKTCLEGDFITPEMVGEYVHYIIRFENTGTANAINIVVKDNIDITKYDLSTLVPLHASHNYFAKIKDQGNDHYIEFIFEGINLPFDDANNDGYVAFKIKTLETLGLGDSFQNDAEIYFDFNFPIVTNNATTTIATLGVNEFEHSNSNVLLYPNPTTNDIHLKAKQIIENVNIYDISGRLIQTIAVIGSKTSIDISTEKLNSGTYFVKIEFGIGAIVKKIVKD